MTELRRIDAVGKEFAEAAERHLDGVYAFLVYLTGDRNVAEDLTAETFARALERWRKFDPRRGSGRAWRCPARRVRGRGCRPPGPSPGRSSAGGSSPRAAARREPGSASSRGRRPWITSARKNGASWQSQ